MEEVRKTIAKEGGGEKKKMITKNTERLKVDSNSDQKLAGRGQVPSQPQSRTEKKVDSDRSAQTWSA